MIDLRLGDCLDVMRTMDDASVDAVITDPPYGTDVPRDGYGRRNLGSTSKRIAGDSNLDVMRAALAEAPRLLRNNGFALVFCSPKRHAEASEAVTGSGLAILGEIVWDKNRPGLGGGIRYQHECILICGKGKPRGRSGLFSVLRHTSPRAGRFHPHQKPVGLLVDLVRYASDEGGTILDPFMGSGTTGEACIRTGRRFIGIESHEPYYRIAERRLESAHAVA